MRFKKYMINEASFRNSDLEKAVKLLTNVLGRSVGSQFYPFGGHNNNTERFKKGNGKSGIGMKYVLETGKMVRFNLEKGGKSSLITSVDIWDDMKTPEKPTANLPILKGINILEVVKIVSKFIKTSYVGIISEASYGPTKIALAKEFGVDINLSQAEFRKAVTLAKKELKSIKGVKEVSTHTTEIKVAEEKLKKKVVADPDILFADLDDLVSLVASGIQPSLLVTGLSGVGKTYTVTKKVQEIMGAEGGKWKLIKGKASPLGLYSELFLNRNKLIVFDDIDSIFKNTDTVLMLKAALDSYDKRTISWISPMTRDVSQMSNKDIEKLYIDIEEQLADPSAKKPPKFPSAFEFTGRIIFITNLNESKIDSALKSRSFVIDITLESKDIFKRMESILGEIGGNILPMNEKKEVLDYLKEMKKSGKETNMRTLLNGFKVKSAGLARWKHLAANYG